MGYLYHVRKCGKGAAELEKMTLKCHHCAKPYRSKAGLAYHLRSEHGPVSTACSFLDCVWGCIHGECSPLCQTRYFWFLACTLLSFLKKKKSFITIVVHIYGPLCSILTCISPLNLQMLCFSFPCSLLDFSLLNVIRL